MGAAGAIFSGGGRCLVGCDNKSLGQTTEGKGTAAAMDSALANALLDGRLVVVVERPAELLAAACG